MNNKTKRAAIYCRTATSDQQGGQSLAKQEQDCREFAEANGYEVGEVLSETASVANTDRERLAWLRTEILNGDYDAVIATNADRISRNAAQLMMILEECEQTETELLFANGKLENEPTGRFLSAVKGFLNEVESEKTRSRGKLYSDEAVVRRIIDEYTGGASPAQIAERLNA